MICVGNLLDVVSPYNPENDRWYAWCIMRCVTAPQGSKAGAWFGGMLKQNIRVAGSWFRMGRDVIAGVRHDLTIGGESPLWRAG